MDNATFYDAIYKENPDKWAIQYRDYFAYWTIETCHGQPKSLLEIGCGNGHALAYMHEHWPDTQFFGLDISPEACRLAKIRAPFATIYNAEMSTINQEFDVVVLMGVVEHFKNLRHDLKQLQNFLAYNGMLYIEVPNCLAYSANKGEGFRKTSDSDTEQEEWHLKRDTWENMILDAGYRIARAIEGPTIETQFVWVLKRNSHEAKKELTVSIIIPSTGRPEQLLACVQQLLKVSPSVEVVCVIEHDEESLRVMQESGLPVIILYRDEFSGPVKCLNDGAACAKGDVFVTSSDDVWFHDNWLEEALKALDSIGGTGLVGLNSLKKLDKDWDDHYLVTRDYAKSAFGGVIAVPHYRHYGTDVEACRHAAMDKRYVYAENAIVEHRHFVVEKSDKDKTYDLDHSWHRKDERMWKIRQEQGWPIDYEPVF